MMQPSVATPPDSPPAVLPHTVLLASRCRKQARWLRLWRGRWLVLTAEHILSFPLDLSAGGEKPAQPTDAIALSQLARVRVQPLKGARRHHATRMGLLSRGRSAVWVEFATLRAASTFATAAVNARLHLATGLPEYEPASSSRGSMIAFEPVRLVGCEERYVIGKMLGQGKYGQVYKAVCMQSGVRMAVKVLPLADETTRASAMQELAIMRRIDHPHVVHLANYFETANSAQLVMEWLPGGDLYAQLIERFSPEPFGVNSYSESQIRSLTFMALSGLHALHELRIVHRDIKPENLLLVNRSGGLLDLRIADLGMARWLAEGERCDDSAGTPGYMAPEVAAGARSGVKADIFSLGVLLFVLLSGESPLDFDGTEWGEGRNEKERLATYALQRTLVELLELSEELNGPAGQQLLDTPGWFRDAIYRHLQELESQLEDVEEALGSRQFGGVRTRALALRARAVHTSISAQAASAVGDAESEIPFLARLEADESAAAAACLELERQRASGWSFSHANWSRVSDDMKRVVAAMLDVDSSSRPTARSLLSHPWLSSHELKPPQRRSEMCEECGTADEVPAELCLHRSSGVLESLRLFSPTLSRRPLARRSLWSQGVLQSLVPEGARKPLWPPPGPSIQPSSGGERTRWTTVDSRYSSQGELRGTGGGPRPSGAALGNGAASRRQRASSPLPRSKNEAEQNLEDPF